MKHTHINAHKHIRVGLFMTRRFCVLGLLSVTCVIMCVFGCTCMAVHGRLVGVVCYGSGYSRSGLIDGLKRWYGRFISLRLTLPQCCNSSFFPFPHPLLNIKWHLFILKFPDNYGSFFSKCDTAMTWCRSLYVRDGWRELLLSFSISCMVCPTIHYVWPNHLHMW